MLKNDMRKYIIQGKSFEEFLEDYGDSYRDKYGGGFTDEVMRKCWKNTHKLVPQDAWLKYLKNSAATEVRYLTMCVEALNEQGIRLQEIRAGYMLSELMKKQIYGSDTN